MESSAKEEKQIKRELGNLIDEDRVVNFSDAVFAFAATLLVLKIDLPAIIDPKNSDQLINTFVSLGPQYLANIISFLVIGYYWINHHALFKQIRKIDTTLVWLNLTFLIAISFLPFPIDLYGDYMTTPLIVAFYSGSLAIAGFLLVVLWWYASHNNRLVGESFSRHQRNYYLARNLIAPLVFTLAIPLVFVDPLLAQFSWILVIVGLLIVNHDFKKV